MAKELIYKVRIDYDADSASRGGQRLERSQENAEQAVDKTTQAIKRQQQASERASNSQRNFRKATSNANQTLFTFGDLINDAQQFQFGFAQGSRAIGNNIAFAAEQISNTSNRAGGFVNTLKALGSSLLGPGGIILAVNVAVTALTVFGDALFDTQDKASLVKKEIDELGDSVQRFNDLAKALADEGVFGEDAFNLAQLQAEQGRVNRRLQENKRILDELGFSEQNLARIKELRNIRDQEGLDLTAEQLKELQSLISQQSVGIDVVEEYQQENAQLEARLEQINTKIDEQREKQQDLNTVTGGLTLGLSDLQKKYIDLNLDIATFNDQLAESVNQIGEVSRAASIEVDTTFLQPERGADELFGEDPLTPLFQTQLEKEMAFFDQRISNFQSFQDTKTQITRIAEAQREEIFVNAIGAAGDLIGQAFGQSKELAIAQTIVSTFAAAQKAYESQLTIPTPDAPARAAAAAAVAIAQGLARVASIRSTEIGSSGGSRSGSGGGSTPEGFSSGNIRQSESERRFTGRANQRNQPTFVVEANNVLPDTEFSVRAENGRKGRVANVRKVQSV